MNKLKFFSLLNRNYSFKYNREPKSKFVIQQCQLHNKSNNAPLPRIMYMPNFFEWFRSKLKLWTLKQWDSDFSEGAFRYGTRQAVSVVTNILQSRKYEQLTGLMTRSARSMLIYEFETRWPTMYKNHIGLRPEQIQLIMPKRVDLNRSLGRKICEVNLVFIGLKWSDIIPRQRALVFIETLANFKRDFDHRLVAEWTITSFKINKFRVIRHN